MSRKEEEAYGISVGLRMSTKALASMYINGQSIQGIWGFIWHVLGLSNRCISSDY